MQRIKCCQCEHVGTKFRCAKCGHSICTACKDAEPRGRREGDQYVSAAEGQRLRIERKRRELSQLQFALSLGITDRTLWKAEKGSTWVRADVYRAIRPFMEENETRADVLRSPDRDGNRPARVSEMPAVRPADFRRP